MPGRQDLVASGCQAPECISRYRYVQYAAADNKRHPEAVLRAACAHMPTSDLRLGMVIAMQSCETDFHGREQHLHTCAPNKIIASREQHAIPLGTSGHSLVRGGGDRVSWTGCHTFSLSPARRDQRDIFSPTCAAPLHHASHTGSVPPPARPAVSG